VHQVAQGHAYVCIGISDPSLGVPYKLWSFLLEKRPILASPFSQLRSIRNLLQSLYKLFRLS
jgi:hypothetical protein